MDCDELIHNLLSPQGADNEAPHTKQQTDASAVHRQPECQVPYQVLQKYCERLPALLAGGQTKQCFGKHISVDQVNALNDADIEKLYARNEAGLGVGRGGGGGVR